MIERVICKDSDSKISSKTIARILGWKHVKFSDVDIHSDSISATVQDTRHSSKCPCCHKRSTHVHSYYVRHVADLSIHGKQLVLDVIAPRYKCENPKCKRKTFVGQIEGLTERYSRRTVEAREYLEQVLVLTPSTVGSLQMKLSGMPISPSTALRIVYGIKPEIDYGSVKRICIDDFASRKGQTYRTLIADADTGLPLEIVKSRNEEDVREALKKYKKVKVVSRDRAGAYSKAIKAALPRAQQIADRFHLVKNSSEHIENAIKHNIRAITEEVTGYIGKSATSPPTQMFLPPTDEDIKLYNDIKKLRNQGKSCREIGQILDIGHSRVYDIINREEPRGRKITTPKLLLPYLNVIDNCVKAGLGYKETYNVMVESGYEASLDAVKTGMKKLYPMYKPKPGTWPGRNDNMAKAEQPHKTAIKMLSSGNISLYVTNPDYGVDKKTGLCSEEHNLAEIVIKSSITLRELRDTHITFRNILKGNADIDLDAWIEKYSKSRYPDVKSFATSVARDKRPIMNAINNTISNGLIEGLNNKIKAVKRSMYGRASDRLLWIKMYQTGLQLQHGN